jgi:hypothetical protein
VVPAVTCLPIIPHFFWIGHDALTLGRCCGLEDCLRCLGCLYGQGSRAFLLMNSFVNALLLSITSLTLFWSSRQDLFNLIFNGIYLMMVRIVIAIVWCMMTEECLTATQE